MQNRIEKYLINFLSLSEKYRLFSPFFNRNSFMFVWLWERREETLYLLKVKRIYSKRGYTEHLILVGNNSNNICSSSSFCGTYFYIVHDAISHHTTLFSSYIIFGIVALLHFTLLQFHSFISDSDIVESFAKKRTYFYIRNLI